MLTRFSSPSSVAAASALQAEAKENGAAGPELDEASRRKAESSMFFFYEVHMEPDAATQGLADFN